jgi:hypothetical protein
MINWKEDELWEAVSGKDLNGVRASIKKGAKVDYFSKEAKGSKSLLHHAASIGFLPVFELLADDGAGGRQHTWDGLRGNGNTPFHLAAMYNRLDIVKWCVANGSDVNMPGEVGYTCLHLASKHGHGEMVAYLLDVGARTDIIAGDQRTPVMLAKTPEVKDLFDYFRMNSGPTPPTLRGVGGVDFGAGTGINSSAGSLGSNGVGKGLGGESVGRVGGHEEEFGMNSRGSRRQAPLPAEEIRRGKAGLGLRPASENPYAWHDAASSTSFSKGGNVIFQHKNCNTHTSRKYTHANSQSRQHTNTTCIHHKKLNIFS